CDFVITVSNTGAGPFTGPIEIAETVQADGVVVPSTLIQTPGPNAPWTCTKTDLTFACTTPATTTLAAGAKLDLMLSFRLGDGAAAAKQIENCAVLKGTAAPACAKILLSPKQGPMLRAEKTLVSGDCAQGCDFIIRVKNVGNLPYSGPITLMDVM